MNLLKSTLLLFKDALTEFREDRATLFAAGLAYYTVFSLAPLLVFTTSVAGFFIGRSLAGEQIILQLQYIIGGELAKFVESDMSSLMDRSTSTTTAVISVVVLLFGAGGIFRQTKAALNLVWGITDVRPKTFHEWLILARHQAIPFLMVFLLGFLLSLTVIVETLLSAVLARFDVLFPDVSAFIPQINLLFIPLLTFITFLLVFKLLPDARTRWRDMAVGALVTTVLFMIGRALLTVFISYSNTGSLYGAAGSIVILLFWIYYSAQIILYGAEFTGLYAKRYGRPIRPRRLSRILELEEQSLAAEKQSG